MRAHLQANSYGNAVSADFENVMETASGKDLTAFFDQWLNRPGRPTYSWSWRQTTTPQGTTQLELTITQTQAPPAFAMPVDITVVDASAGKKTFVVQNTAKSQTFTLDLGVFQPTDVQLDPGNFILKTVAGATPSPTLQSVLAVAPAGTASLRWTSGGGTTSGFQIVESTDLLNWTTIADETTLTSGVTTFARSGLNPTLPTYYRVRSVSATTRPSSYSDTYGLRLGTGSSRVLIVDGYDRWDAQARGTSHPFAATHGAAVAAYPIAFDTCANEALLTANPAPTPHNAPLRLDGEESTTDETFSSAEQNLVTTYLRAGGRLLISGSEIGWDLWSQGNTADRDFYGNTLKAAYLADNSGIFNVSGTTGAIFEGLTFAYGTATAGSYPVGTPDVIAPANGSAQALEFTGGAGAAVQFSGTFAAGTAPGKLVYLAIPFETISTAADRNTTMAKTLQFFGLQPENPPSDSFLLY